MYTGRTFDFSCRHHILIRNEDNSFSRMDEPYFLSRLIAPGTWQILGDGDFTYLAEGEEEALVIDSGYGCGSIREYCSSLTKKPVRKVANTHSHFDHTANNGYFECAYMSAVTKGELLNITKPSLEGVRFPMDYQVQIIEEGYVFRLGERNLEVLKMPDHDEGSLVFLDRKQHLLFSGDEIPMQEKRLKGSVERFAAELEKLMRYRQEIDMLCTGAGVYPAVIIERYLRNAEYILFGHEGGPAWKARKVEEEEPGPNGETVYRRRLPRPCDQKIENRDMEYKRAMTYAGCTIIYDVRRIREDN